MDVCRRLFAFRLTILQVKGGAAVVAAGKMREKGDKENFANTAPGVPSSVGRCQSSARTYPARAPVQGANLGCSRRGFLSR